MKNINVGLIGLGNVGRSVYDILIDQFDIISGKSASKIVLRKVSSRTKKDFIDEKRVSFTENAIDLAKDPEIDVIVEVAGGDSGLIYEVWKEALKNGKKIVTANKAMIANKGYELLNVALENNGYFTFEASVAGAIPIIKTLKEGLSANKISSFLAILNGTSNYILTKMKDEGLDFSTALKQAQDLGYAESDPTFDIEGIDTAHKLSILSAIAASKIPAFEKIYIEGISKINIDDIKFAEEFGYKIKLLAIYKDNDSSQQQYVFPAFIDKLEKISMIDDSFNAICLYGSNCDFHMSVGRGAGGRQTASAVVADIIDIANDRLSFEFGVSKSKLNEFVLEDINNRLGNYFIKIQHDNDANFDKKTFFEDIRAVKSCIYKNESGTIIHGIITDTIKESDLKKILNLIETGSKVKTSFIRIEKLTA